MLSELFVEIQKLEVRLNNYLEEEEKAIGLLTMYITKIREQNDLIKSLAESKKPESIEKMAKLRIEVAKAFRNALRGISKAEHEKSHLLESYGQILLVMEEQIQRILKRGE